jgi:hypothetical protein
MRSPAIHEKYHIDQKSPRCAQGRTAQTYVNVPNAGMHRTLHPGARPSAIQRDPARSSAIQRDPARSRAISCDLITIPYRSEVGSSKQLMDPVHGITTSKCSTSMTCFPEKIAVKRQCLNRALRGCALAVVVDWREAGGGHGACFLALSRLDFFAFARWGRPER